MEQQQQYLTPSILSSGKFSRFTSPMFEKGCWRIGTISDGSCFFHAIVTSLSKSYRDTEVYTEKIDKVKSIRTTIGSKIDSSNWEGLQNGEPCQFKFLEQLRIIETELVKFIKKPQRYTGRKDRAWIKECAQGASTFSLLSSVMTKNLFEMNEFTKNCTNSFGKYKTMKERKSIFVKMQLKGCVERFEKKIKQLQDNFESSEIECAVLDYKRLLEKAVDLAETRGLKELIKSFSNTSTWVGTEYLSFLGDQFNMNIFIVTGTTGLPYPVDEKAIVKGRSNIFLLHVDECHFESLGFEIRSNGSRPKIRCKLPWDHDIVKKFINYDKSRVEVVASDNESVNSDSELESDQPDNEESTEAIDSSKQVEENEQSEDDDSDTNDDEEMSYSSSENEDSD